MRIYYTNFVNVCMYVYVWMYVQHIDEHIRHSIFAGICICKHAHIYTYMHVGVCVYGQVLKWPLHNVRALYIIPRRNAVASMAAATYAQTHVDIYEYITHTHTYVGVSMGGRKICGN